MAPPPEQLAEPPIPVPVADPACPGCGGELTFDRVEEASITDLPPVPRPHLRFFEVDQHLAAAHLLHYGLGVIVRKLPEVLRLLAGVTITQGAITLDALRQGLGAVGAKYRELADSVRQSPSVHTDDTGWRRLWHERRAGPVVWDFATRMRRVIAEVTHHLRDRVLPDRNDQRLLDGLGGCHDAGSLLRFPENPSIEPTNNRAERSLRPAVIARKVSQCTKTPHGTRAFEAWTSVLGTYSRTVSKAALLDAIVELIRPTAPQPA